MMTVDAESIQGLETARHVPEKITTAHDSPIIAAEDSASLPVEKLRRDPAKFAQWYRRHYDGVFRYCVHRLFDRTAAEDMTSTVFLRVIENLPRFRGDERALSAWLFRIATNSINSYLREYRKRKQLLEKLAQKYCDHQTGCESEPEQAEKIVILSQALLALRPRYQTVITLYYFEGKKLSEIAEILGGLKGKNCLKLLKFSAVGK